MSEFNLTKAEYLNTFETWISVFWKTHTDDQNFELVRKNNFKDCWNYIQGRLKQDKVLDNFDNQPRDPNEFCAAIFKWAKESDKEDDKEFWKNWFTVELAVSKSCLLNRLIYCGEQLRTTPCPRHKGYWSGCVGEARCECMCGSNITGWLPNESDAKAKEHAPTPEQLAEYKAKHPNGPDLFTLCDPELPK